MSAPHQNLCSRSLAGLKRLPVTEEIAGSNPVGCENILVRGHERKPARLDRKAVGRVEGSNPFGLAKVRFLKSSSFDELFSVLTVHLSLFF